MDVRGIEVTNQLRSAIRAKLLELGVRYDEELPDYILVMVVNKKSRQQMHEDLNLFLENNTTPFVDWLHDQVLKKLQKVTIPKKKATREFVPMVIVKQEEERKKKRSNSVVDEKSKEEIPQKSQSPSKSDQNFEEESLNIMNEEMQVESSPARSPPHPPISGITKSSIIEAPALSEKFEKRAESVSSTSKRNFEREVTPERSEKRLRIDAKVPEKGEMEIEERRLKSSVNKPRITSVVSVKTRLGVTSPRKKFEQHRDRNEEDEHRRKEQRSDKKTYEVPNRRNNFRGRFFDDEMKKNKEEVKTRLLGKDVNEKNTVFSIKSRNECTGSIKDRLGVAPKLRSKESQDESGRNFRNRIGNATIKFRALGRLGIPRPNREENFHDDTEIDDDDTNVPVKSHIIAVNNTIDKGDKRNQKSMKKLGDDEKEEEEDDDDDEEGKVLASKVIVTPRPLKPLQPVQKRATQSLLLRAVAEANQSVVKQKNPEPILKEKKPVLKRLRASGTREIGQNLAVHLNATKRLVMEKIQVELTNPDTMENEEPEPYVPRSVTEEQMGVVMSLFQRGDDNQKFLVTLNGYNNNVQKTASDDDERLEVEEDELVLSNTPNDSFAHNDSSDNFQTFESEDLERTDKIDDENNENHCNDNLSVDDSPRKRRKLSPIVYTRSPSPEDSKGTTVSSVITGFEKRSPVATVIITDTSREKCRYWPNCTLGSKCGYLHPAVPCSAFPTCKFGEKCSYKHPKCKFGLSCTKLGCIFSHPSQQCKYHPYCTKPGCTYLHPKVQSISSGDITRAKFTWRRRD